MHPDLLREPIPLACVAGAARRDDVRPVVGPAARQRDEVVAGERLTRLELHHVAAAVLAAVAVSREQEGVRHLPPEAPRHVDELGESDDGGTWERESLGADRL